MSELRNQEIRAITTRLRGLNLLHFKVYRQIDIDEDGLQWYIWTEVRQQR